MGWVRPGQARQGHLGAMVAVTANRQGVARHGLARPGAARRGAVRQGKGSFRAMVAVP